MDIPIKHTQHVEVDTERQHKAHEYARIRRRLSFISIGISGVGIMLIFLTGFDVWLRNVLLPLNWQPFPNAIALHPHPLPVQQLFSWSPFIVAGYLLILTVGYTIITSPLSYYSGFVLPHRFGLSTMTLRGWLGDQLKGFALGLVFEVVVIELIYLLLATQPVLWWLWVALILLFFSVGMAHLAPVLLLPLFYKFSPLPDGNLKQRLVALADRAHTRIQGVFTMHMSSKTTAANAALMGLGNTRRIVLGDTMVDRYTPDEIEVVLAHELGHHVHRDIWKLIVSQALFTLLGLFLFNLCLYWAVANLDRYHGIADPATLPLLLVLVGVFGFIIAPLTNGYSRAIEYQADEYALQATHMVEPFKSAMTRLANQNLSEIEPSPIVEFLFYDHPSIGKRLTHAEKFKES
ncbi:MAG: M48 family metallopeptidase [Ktedonobacteraceae bacterium]